MEFPRSQRIRTVRVAAAQLAQRAKQTLAVSPPSFLAHTTSLCAPQEHASSLGILPEVIEISSATRGPGDPAGFAFHEFQHSSEISERFYAISQAPFY